MHFQIINSLQMIFKFVEQTGEAIIILKVLIHIPVFKQNLLTGKILQSLYSPTTGIFVDNILIQNIEEQFMVHIYQEKMQLPVSLVKFLKITGLIKQHPKIMNQKAKAHNKEVMKSITKKRIKEEIKMTQKVKKDQNSKEKRGEKKMINQVQVKVNRMRKIKIKRENKVIDYRNLSSQYKKIFNFLPNY